MRVLAGLAVALALSACGGRIVPPSGVSGSVPPASREPARARPHGQTIVDDRLDRLGGYPAGQIVPATPLPAAMAFPPAGATTAVAAGVIAGPPVASLPIDPRLATATVVAFRRSCPSLQRRTDASGLTRGTDWQPACAAAATVSGGGEVAFLQRYFEAVQVGDGRSFATGYYEPEIRGSLERRAGCDAPVYGRPTDLVDVDLGQFAPDLKGRKIRGRVQGSAFVPYYDRSQIDGGAVAATAPVLGYACDSVELFFLQIQGSGRLRLPDGEVLRIGYDTQNGRQYTGIGSLMKARGLLAPGQSSMQGIVQYLHDHPDEGRALMDQNKSFVFFRVLDGPPQGAMGVSVAGGTSAAADPKFVPLGAPVFLSMDRADASGLWVAQDTGGAIKGANRFDTYWGGGRDAAAVAGGMAAHGTAFLLLPVGTLARLAGTATLPAFGSDGATPQP